ncbi:MAG: RDD family protein [Burkholderiales bacterium]|nr:RDD family protein [Burkholderiales bacterium]MDE1925668.1 RDD family protein [Burkholderiales bacterium]MDE2501632.1 RDD family protein [Burkholderiales bacterium]
MTATAPQPPVPPLARRLACFLYEGVLLFGVVMVAGFIYATTTRQHHALKGTHGLQAFLFIVLALYFVTFWSRSGQTLAMQTWQIRLLTRAGERVSVARAFCRYLAAWMWFAPALIGLWLAGVHAPWPSFTTLFVGVLAYAALARLHPERQYWHDALCGTRLVLAPERRPPR